MVHFPAWIVESNNGYSVRQVQSQGDITLAETLDWPFAVYVFQTQAEADAFAVKNGNAAAGKAKPGQNTVGPGVGNNKATANAGNAAVANAAKIGTQWISDLFTAGGSLNMFVRIGEVLLGLVLVAAGIAKMTSAVPIATKVAKTVGVAAL